MPPPFPQLPRRRPKSVPPPTFPNLINSLSRFSPFLSLLTAVSRPHYSLCQPPFSKSKGDKKGRPKKKKREWLWLALPLFPPTPTPSFKPNLFYLLLPPNPTEPVVLPTLPNPHLSDPSQPFIPLIPPRTPSGPTSHPRLPPPPPPPPLQPPLPLPPNFLVLRANGPSTAGNPRRLCSSRNIRIQRSWSRFFVPWKRSRLLCSLEKPGAWRSVLRKPPREMLSSCRVAIVPRVLRSSMPTTSVTPSEFFFKWASF